MPKRNAKYICNSTHNHKNGFTIHRIRLAPTSVSAKKVGETNLITLVEGYVTYVPPYYLIDLQKSRISADKSLRIIS